MKIIFEMPYGYNQLDDLDSNVYPIPRIDEYVIAQRKSVSIYSHTTLTTTVSIQLMVAAVVYDYGYADKSVTICLKEV